MAKDEIRMIACGTGLPAPGKIDVVEFDCKGENQVVYQENGVTIRSWPAIHAGDGAVPDPITDFVKAGRWQPAIDAMQDLVETFKKEHEMK